MRRVLPVIFTLAAVLLLAPMLRAQEGEDYTGETPARPGIPGRAANPGRGSGDITLNVRSFGLGNSARPGEWIGVWVEVSDNSDKVRNVIVRITDRDLDGDDAQMQRVIVTNPGAAQRVWLYMRLPYGEAAGTEFDITASEAVASGSGEGEAQQYSPGRLLGTLRYSVGFRTCIPMGIGTLPVVGAHGAGLEQYKWVPSNPNKVEYALTAHEFTEVSTGLNVASLPDRWHGYSGITALAWTSAASEDNPLNLRKDQADALREYVRRGGHLVIVLPNVGQNWISQPNNPLADIMPGAHVTRTEGVSLEKYRSLLTSDPDVSYPPDSVVHSFTPENVKAWPTDTYPIMVGADGEAVVIRRIVDQGMVTVVGLDLASIKLQQRSHAFMAEQFWNRILGKRMRIPTPSEVAAGRKGQPGSSTAKDAESYEYGGQIMDIDHGVVAAVNNEGTAAIGLLLAFVVFVGYWLLAGPVGYFLLKQRNWKQHAWVAFMLATGVFTAVSWGGANVLKTRRVNGGHLTIIDGVYGQTAQRARAWVGLFLPKYGVQQVSIVPSTGSGTEWHNLIAAWENPTLTGNTGWSNFPDASPYPVECRKPDTIPFPARATTKQIQIDWAGVLPEGWGMPHPLADPSVPVGKEIRLVFSDNKRTADRKWSIEGQVVHNFPAPLKNVWITVVRRPDDRAPLASDPSRRGADVRMEASIARYIPDWKPGETLALDACFDKTSGARDAALDTLGRLVPSATQLGGVVRIDEYPRELMAMGVSFMDMARPAEPTTRHPNEPARTVLKRDCTHGLDLSRWFTQPCVIIIGELGSNDKKDDTVECPLPIRVDNLAPEDVRKRLQGRTIVRWVYPLEAAPFRAGGSLAPSSQSDELDQALDKQSPQG